jgi:hypothetical protein
LTTFTDHRHSLKHPGPPLPGDDCFRAGGRAGTGARAVQAPRAVR